MTDHDQIEAVARAAVVAGGAELRARYRDGDAEADPIRDALGDRVKRVLDSWAPTAHSGLVARGRLQGLVEFRPDEEERAVTELLATEAGAAVRREGDLFLAASDEATLGELRWALDDADR
ncbi:hypothetical protein [Halorubrum yunnanense]|uniref:Uncharacterized protein n=1 Tax=Halorubrum yunnanense TaxID=1526162 RepID=A0ABD5YGX3_9EURY|nr:hypothetical protein [Halorubrum yunnanense]